LASPFGAARPIDTSAREKEIEDKLRLKKEQDDKAREEKRLGDEKAKEEKRLAKEAEKAGKSTLSKEKSAGANKDGDSSDSQNYQILRRATDDEPEGDVDEEANGAIVEDKAVKPQETVRDTSTKKVNGVESDASVSPVADSPENQGWSTVSKATKNRKGGNGGSRAIAS
jgi:translation initiation factor 4B